MTNATRNSLVLIDELGASTDPEEGTALAKALLLHFAQRGMALMATSHHREVAAFVQEQPNMSNASVELDPETLIPTYRLTTGLPGRSYALTIASRLGMEDKTVERARSLLSPVHQRAEALLKELQEERHLAEKRSREAEEALAKVEKTRRKLEEELNAVEDTKAQMMDDARGELQHKVAELNKQLKAAETALEHPQPSHTIKEGKAQLADVRRKLRSPAWQPARPTDKQWIQTLKRGDRAYARGLLNPVEILASPGDDTTVEVLLGSMRAHLPINQLEGPAPMLPQRSEEAMSLPQPLKPIAVQLELQGVRVERALEMLGKYLNDAVLAGLASVRIVHGVGTGALRSAIRERLINHPLVVSALPAEDASNDGATVVQLA